MSSPSGEMSLDALLAHRQWVRRLARSLVADPALADDVEQQTWMAALRRGPREPGSVRGWLGRVARNAAGEHHRAEGRRRVREEAASRSEATGDADDVVATAELHQEVVQGVLALREPYRTTLLLRFFEGLKPAAVAERMGVGSETVRTRQRRALDKLREGLEAKKGGRRPFLQWVAPLASVRTLDVAGSTATTATTTGGSAMLFAKVTAAAGVIMLLAFGVASWAAREPEPAMPMDADAGGVVSDVAPPSDSGEPVVTRSFPGDRHPVPPAPNAGSRPVLPVQPAFHPGWLALHVRMEPDVPRVGETVKIHSVFKNDGTDPVRFFVPQFAGLVPFPKLRVRGARGLLYRPATPSFQSEWSEGVQGKIVELAPGVEHTVTNSVDRWAPVDPKTGESLDRSQGARLPAGSYTLDAVYSQDSTAVPFSDQTFRVREKEISGLWTGTARAAPLSFSVMKSGEPTLTIAVSEVGAPEASPELTVTLRNPGDRAFEAHGVLWCQVHSKGSAAARAPLSSSDGLAADTPASMTVPAAGEKSWSFDMGMLTFDRPKSRWSREAPVRGCLRVVVPRGLMMITVSLVPAGDPSRSLQSDHVFASVPPLPDLAPAGLVLDARAVTDGVPPVVDITLRNTGERSFRIPSALRVGAEVRLDLYRRRPDVPLLAPPGPVSPKRRGVARQRISLRSPKTEVPPVAATVFDAGAFLTLRLDLMRNLRSPLKPGDYELHMRWENLESGVRLGRPDRATVGSSKAAVLSFTVPE